MVFNWVYAFRLFILALDFVTSIGSLIAFARDENKIGTALMIVFLVSIFITGGVLP